MTLALSVPAACVSSQDAAWDLRHDLRGQVYAYELSGGGTAEITFDEQRHEGAVVIRLSRFRDPIAVWGAARNPAAMDVTEAAFDRDGNPFTTSDETPLEVSSGGNVIGFLDEGSLAAFGFWLEIDGREVAFTQDAHLTEVRPSTRG